MNQPKANVMKLRPPQKQTAPGIMGDFKHHPSLHTTDPGAPTVRDYGRGCGMLLLMAMGIAFWAAVIAFIF